MQHATTEQRAQDMYGNSRYLNPTNDVAFKKLFGTEDHKDLLISFLNTMLGLEGKRRIKHVELLPQELPPIIGDGKRSILDVSCVDESDTRYIVEMQNQHVPESAKRAQMYASHAYISQLDRGTTHLELSPVILLAVANYTIFPNKKRYISYHKLLDVQTHEHDLKDVSYVFVELSKFNKQEESELKTIVDKWLYFLKYWGSIKHPPAVITEPEILEAYDTMERFNWNRAELDYYLKADIVLVEDYAAKEEKRAEGYAKGKQEEREKAEHEKAELRREEREKAEHEKAELRREEREKAEHEKAEVRREEREKAEYEKAEVRRKEREKAEYEKVEMVQRMLNQGIDIKTISRVTGIAKGFIAEIARKAG